MARWSKPPKPQRKRTRHVQVRLDEGEWRKLAAKASAAGMTRSELLRDHLDRVTVRNSKELRQLRLELARWGNNLNQLARWANTHRSAAEAAAVILELRELRRALREEIPRWR